MKFSLHHREIKVDSFFYLKYFLLFLIYIYLKPRLAGSQFHPLFSHINGHQIDLPNRVVSYIVKFGPHRFLSPVKQARRCGLER